MWPSLREKFAKLWSNMKARDVINFFTGTLRRRLITSVALVHAVLMSVFIADLALSNRDILRRQQIGNATALANTLATSSAGWIVARDIAGLQELVETQQRYPDLVFSMLLDQHGYVLAHTDRSHLRQKVLDLPGDGQKFRVLDIADLTDVCVPVLLSGKQIGWARVGVSRKEVVRELNRIVRSGIIYAAIAILLGSLMALIMGTLFTRRLKVVQSAMKSVKSGNDNAEVILPGVDEAAALAAVFNEMLDTLRQRTLEITALNATLEQHVSERTLQLQCANKELEAFAYSVSHDLRAPLRAIDGFSGFLEEGYGEKLDAEGRRLLSVIRSNTRKMDRLIIDLLTLSRTSQSELNHARIDMCSLVNEVYSEVIPEEIRRQFKFNLKLLPPAWGDSALLRQVWVNLISNAIKYSMKSPVKEIEVGGSREKGNTVYYIKDSGAGFNPNYASKLFGAFQRLHKAEDFEGSGIGLAIVQRIIHRHEGQVWAEGQENAGATFSFSIPDKSGQAESLKTNGPEK